MTALYWLFLYLVIGAANYAMFAVRGNSLLSYRPRHRSNADLAEAAFEAAFYVLAWPVQLAFFLFTRVVLPVVYFVGEKVLP